MKIEIKNAFDNSMVPPASMNLEVVNDLKYKTISSLKNLGELFKILSESGPVFILDHRHLPSKLIRGIKGGKVILQSFFPHSIAHQSFSEFKKQYSNAQFSYQNLLGEVVAGERYSFQNTRDGYGDWYFNHHMAYFRTTQSDEIIQNAMKSTFDNIASVFSRVNIANLEDTGEYFLSRPVFKFTIDEFIGNFHSDYVTLNPGSRGNFYAKTLKREYATTGENVGMSANPIYGGLAFSTNSKHFLAGRRSWGYTKIAPNVYRIETATIERFSCWKYALAYQLNQITDRQIIEIWSHFLNNILFVNHIKETESIPHSGYDTLVFSDQHPGDLGSKEIHYKLMRKGTLLEMRSDTDFQLVIDRHPELDPGPGL